MPRSRPRGRHLLVPIISLVSMTSPCPRARGATEQNAARLRLWMFNASVYYILIRGTMSGEAAAAAAAAANRHHSIPLSFATHTSGAWLNLKVCYGCTVHSQMNNLFVCYLAHTSTFRASFPSDMLVSLLRLDDSHGPAQNEKVATSIF
jgi:hypothetical protein